MAMKRSLKDKFKQKKAEVAEAPPAETPPAETAPAETAPAETPRRRTRKAKAPAKSVETASPFDVAAALDELLALTKQAELATIRIAELRAAIEQAAGVRE